jgi:uncharacterized repeat protein (TIGR03837 family)
MRWDLFCQVIDNHGDAGVCWRLARELAERGDTVRLWMDDASALAWMAPDGHPRVSVLAWDADVSAIEPGDVAVEAFGCNPPEAFVVKLAAAARARVEPPAWLNLEYLSAEAYVERSHRLPSPITHGPAAGLVKYFFYPGFTPATGGLLREVDWDARRVAFDRAAWLRELGVQPGGRVVSLFCYEPPGLRALLADFARHAGVTDLLVTAGRAEGATQAAIAQLDREHPGWNAAGRLRLHALPLLSQRHYDHLLWASDLNFVRGEDSVVRALLAGKPFVWQLYPQADGAHLAKLEAFLAWLQPPPGWRDFHRAWNGAPAGLAALPDAQDWAAAAKKAAERAHALPELAAGLKQFAAGRGRI